MSIKKRAVRVHQIPECTEPGQAEHFLHDLRQHIANERPRFVIDCSKVKEMDDSVMQLLLSCLEEAMKCNGDVRLASLHPEAESILRAAGVNRIFEMFSSAESAVQSFHQRATSMAPMGVRTRFTAAEHAA